ncbi:MAG TPA: carboxypeptidase-like regulatory domain-containing protein, partial [Edaphobacter sp.]
MPLDRRSVLLSLLFVLPASDITWAQNPAASTVSGSGEIRLGVKDPGGRPLQAHVSLEGPGRRKIETAQDGSLNLTGLPFGRYQVRIDRAGFTTQVIRLQVQSATPVSREVVLAIGGVSTSVEVMASTPIGTLDLPLSDVPVPVQSVTAETIRNTNAIDLTDVLKRR